eukprot:gb/GECH01009899.1/.p1 GENE.gb/GECH01009899.1/~~gb/GECH01009899.1/.p1  ORF type:complete len:149 (+),score=46.77 gb/GECH01009899.1/:1-447(+)
MLRGNNSDGSDDNSTQSPNSMGFVAEVLLDQNLPQPVWVANPSTTNNYNNNDNNNTDNDSNDDNGSPPRKLRKIGTPESEQKNKKPINIPGENNDAVDSISSSNNNYNKNFDENNVNDQQLGNEMECQMKRGLVEFYAKTINRRNYEN